MILNHRMDTLFSHSNIRFDYDHGIYYPTVNGKQEITVEATDETLLHWTINALNRHGYTCLQTQNVPAGLPHLQVIAPDALYLTRAGNNGHSLRSEVAGRNKIKTRINHSGPRAVSLCKSTI